MSDLLILAPAFVAGLLVLLSHVALGRAVLKRGIIFIDLAIAQIAGLGVILAHTLGWEVHGFYTQGVALAAALCGAFLLGKAEAVLREQQEALIGISFVLAATAGLLLLAHDPHGGEQLRELLIGQILWVSWQDLVPLAVATVLFGVLYWRVPDLMASSHFYLIFAVMITFSVQVVGVYLVFASLVIPAFALYHNPHKPRLKAFVLGVFGYVAGMLLSLYLDLPTGAAIVWSLAVLAAIYLIATKKQRNKAG